MQGRIERARLGLGRTFQAATLFPELTVREVVELALEARATDVVLGHRCSSSPASTRLERRRRSEAAELIDFLGLGRYADRFVAELSTGTRRIVELAAAAGRRPRRSSAWTSPPPAWPSARPRPSGR